MNEIYKRQVSLLLSVLPEILKEDCFTLPGGDQDLLNLKSIQDTKIISISEYLIGQQS